MPQSWEYFSFTFYEHYSTSKKWHIKNQLQILQDNLRLRNLYNQHIAFNEKEEILKMEEKIKKNISDLPEQLDLLVYNQKDDCLMKIEYKDYELNYSVI